jgi:hypothetical protein
MPANHNTRFHAASSSKSSSISASVSLSPFKAPQIPTAIAMPIAAPATQWLCPAASTKWPGCAAADCATRVNKQVKAKRIAGPHSFKAKAPQISDETNDKQRLVPVLGQPSLLQPLWPNWLRWRMYRRARTDLQTVKRHGASLNDTRQCASAHKTSAQVRVGECMQPQ